MAEWTRRDTRGYVLSPGVSESDADECILGGEEWGRTELAATSSPTIWCAAEGIDTCGVLQYNPDWNEASDYGDIADERGTWR